MEDRNIGKINLSTLIIIIAIMIIIMMSCLMYKTSKEKENKIAEIETLNNKIHMLENEKLEDGSSETNENSQISAFEKYQKNYKKSFEELISQDNQILIWLEDKGIEGVTNVYVDSNGNAYIQTSENSDLRSKYGEKKQVNTNIANINVCTYGNGGLYDIVFLKKDGTANKISGSKLANGEIEIENISNVKNAISIISYMELNEMGAGGSTYAFIDIDGNIIK